MKKIFLITLSLILMNLTTLAQKENSKTDGLNLSGTWILEVKKSFSYKERQDGYEDYTLEILQKETEVKIAAAITFKGKEFKHTLVLFPDKRGEENVQVFEQIIYPQMLDAGRRDQIIPIQLEEIRLKTKTFLDKDELTRRGVYTATGTNHILFEQYKLSKDGKTLTINCEIRTQVPPVWREMAMRSWRFKLIFHKKES